MKYLLALLLLVGCVEKPIEKIMIKAQIEVRPLWREPYTQEPKWYRVDVLEKQDDFWKIRICDGDCKVLWFDITNEEIEWRTIK